MAPRQLELIEYWGCVSGHDLRGAGVDIPDADLSKDTYACVWMIDDVVIKVENLKAHIRQRQEERREKYSFLFAYRSRSELLEHLREAQETWEERRRK